MLPPVNPGILERNPNFAALYKDLCVRKLNPDGSTRETKKQRIHEEIRRNLTTVRKSLTSTQILIDTLSDLPFKAAELPPELHSVIEILTAQLSGRVSDDDREILSGDVEIFLDHISIISELISEQLATIASHLCRIVDPLNPPAISLLPTKVAEIQEKALTELPAELATERVELANTAYTVLSMHRQMLESSIKILEQTMHGSLARATKAKAEHLHARSTALGLQARIHTLTHPPPNEFVNALGNYRASQGSTEVALKNRAALAKKALELYDRAGERAMRDIAKRATYLKGEIERTRGEIGKLERGE
ncbi:hypothetical protein CC78DRAFT_286780 [Lojkania enalia]|uniref:Uncharacterized protein n=1 Tax=Lojkania enalia TaxID=147567 RepID=A0A9P4N7X2_9PLEO|nr:hypothetical protein CC78DRAFT_286780 [Didymosphaeria enalia]